MSISSSTRNASFALALASTALMCTGPAAFAAVDITNGTFETGAVGDTSISGWTVINERIDLGVDDVAGCATVDTTTYDGFPEDYASHSEMVDRNDSFVNDSDLFDVTYSTTIADGTALIGSYARPGQVLRLSSTMDTDNEEAYGYLVHGPAVYSDTFTAKTIDDLTVSWAATGENDDYHVFGYLLNTNSCEQIEVIDSTGDSSEWDDVSVAIPENGTYRFVFVSGTYDFSWGGYAGAILLLDDIILTVNEERAAESGGGSSKGELAATGFDAQALGLIGILAAAAGGAIAFLRRKFNLSGRASK